MPVCVAGMHRSGTSMVMRLLVVGGFYVGAEKDLYPPLPENADGFWENTKFVGLNDEILSCEDGGWDHPPAAPVGTNTDDWPRLISKAKPIVNEFHDHGEPWGWKDPRNSLTLPFWQMMLPGLKVILCLRNPLEVAFSLHERNNFSFSLGLRLWEAYNRSILQHTTPADRLVTHNDIYFQDPMAEVRRVLGFVGLATANGAVERSCTSVTTTMRHWHVTTQHLLDSGVSTEISSLYAQLCEEACWIDAGTPQGTRPHESESLLQLLADTTERRVKCTPVRVSRIWEEQCLRQDLSARDAEIRSLHQAVEEQIGHTGQTEDKLVQRDVEVGTLRAELRAMQTQRDAEVAALRAEIRAVQTQRDAEVSALRAEVREMQAQRGADLAAAQAELRDMHTKLKSERARALSDKEEKAKRAIAVGYFNNGVRIPEMARTIYLSMDGDAQKFGDPINTECPSYFNWLNESVDAESDPSRVITQLWYNVYKLRSDLQQAYPDVMGADRSGFLQWITEHGASEYDVDQHFLPCLVKAAPPTAGD